MGEIGIEETFNLGVNCLACVVLIRNTGARGEYDIPGIVRYARTVF
ncbi:MAG: hypothetical protein K0Q94_3871 [Paenibacillus sp.]|jgi:hypothetical protein|nr:hypothetical protein [Paenibacillus sp.]